MWYCCYIELLMVCKYLNALETEQVEVSTPSQECTFQLDFKVTNSNNPLILHWGGIRDSKE